VKYYIATRLERAKDHNLVRDTLMAQGHEITYDWTTHGPVFRDGLKRIKEVAHLEMDGVSRADLVIALLPGGRGTHIEIGMALGMGKPVLLHQPTQSESYDMFGATTETCAFYHHSLCFQAPPCSLDALWCLALPWLRRFKEVQS
jgi:hypothetical protein